VILDPREGLDTHHRVYPESSCVLGGRPREKENALGGRPREKENVFYRLLVSKYQKNTQTQANR
jgi:hypothetical protein